MRGVKVPPGPSAGISEYCRPVSGILGRQHLRSADSGVLYVPRTKTAFGGRSFAVHSPVTWNSLPVDLRSPEISFSVFTKRLKTFLLAIDCCLRCI